MLGGRHVTRHRNQTSNHSHKTTLTGYVLIVFTMNRSSQLTRDDPWPAMTSTAGPYNASSSSDAPTDQSFNASSTSWLLPADVNDTTWLLAPNDTTSLVGNNMALADDGGKYNWYFLLLLVFVITGGLGNVLVCLSICLEKKLQNLTNYFLLSLAVADLLVSLVVMPFGISSGLYSKSILIRNEIRLQQ